VIFQLATRHLKVTVAHLSPAESGLCRSQIEIALQVAGLPGSERGEDPKDDRPFFAVRLHRFISGAGSLTDQWTTHWPLLDGTVVPDDMKTGMTAAQLTQIDNREAVKHTLGNLTLLTQPANSEGKNFEFKRKCERLKTSLLAMNQDIASLDGWSEEEIRRRSAQLARLAVKALARSCRSPMTLTGHHACRLCESYPN
jgi:hypothetical protein